MPNFPKDPAAFYQRYVTLGSVIQAKQVQVSSSAEMRELTAMQRKPGRLQRKPVTPWRFGVLAPDRGQV
jgi:hypothetical protein